MFASLFHHFTDHPLSLPAYHSIRQSVNQSISQSTSLFVIHQLVFQSIRLSVNLLIHQSVTHSFTQSVFQPLHTVEGKDLHTHRLKTWALIYKMNMTENWAYGHFHTKLGIYQRGHEQRLQSNLMLSLTSCTQVFTLTRTCGAAQ